MSFDWADYLKLAEALTRDPSSPGPEEASLRTAISRAYYAAYRSASNLAASRTWLWYSPSSRPNSSRSHRSPSPTFGSVQSTYVGVTGRSLASSERWTDT